MLLQLRSRQDQRRQGRREKPLISKRPQLVPSYTSSPTAEKSVSQSTANQNTPKITIPAPVNTGGLVTSYSIDVPLYPGLFFGISNSGGISFQTRMSPGQFDIYVTATNSGGEDIKRIRIILTT